jgi:uncharacterized iron-regulated protein
MGRQQMKWALSLLLAGTVPLLEAQKPAYTIFDSDGKKVKYEKVVQEASGADLLLFGELHNNPISHWLQLELTRDLYGTPGRDLVLGAEMFEADNQLILDEYLLGHISEEKFEEEARLWENYQTDYKPLVTFARKNGIRFVATNIPRRYASTVFKEGLHALEKLSDQAKQYIVPLPLVYDTTLNCYSQLKGEGGSPMGGHGSIHLADAQAIKDATMAHFIIENWTPGRLFIHYNGAYHSDYREGMNWFLLRDLPQLKIITLSTVSQEKVETLEEGSLGKADFIICVPSTMTATGR